MPRSTGTSGTEQLGLFEQEQANIALRPEQGQRLASLIEALLLEIAVALASEEAGDDQDHR